MSAVKCTSESGQMTNLDNQSQLQILQLGGVVYFSLLGEDHGGKSKGTTCVVDRDVTAYMVVDRVLRFPTE